MRQKYIISKNDAGDALIVQEHAELFKEIFSLMYEEKYEIEILKKVLDKDKIEIYSTLRTANLYPPGLFMDDLIESIGEVINSNEDESIELIFDDKEMLSKNQPEPTVTEEVENEVVELDEMLDDSTDDGSIDDSDIKNLSTSIKVADDETLDIDEE